MNAKQIFFVDVGKAAILNVEQKITNPHQVLVRDHYTVISAGTERANIMDMPNTFAYGRWPKQEGYSGVGIVEEVGSEVTSVKKGDRVLVIWGKHGNRNVVDESNVILIKAMEEGEDYESQEEIAKVILDMMSAEAMTNVRVSFGGIVKELKDVSKSYKEAKMALEVGKIFYSEKNVIAYSTLGIGRLIYQLPVNLCRMFIEEVFGENIPDDLDDETLITINKFFENSLNVSETSRQLFVHRNTLVYRIEKIQRSLGLDLRNFDDALTFKIALMVVNYMEYLDNLDF